MTLNIKLSIKMFSEKLSEIVRFLMLVPFIWLSIPKLVILSNYPQIFNQRQQMSQVDVELCVFYQCISSTNGGGIYCSQNTISASITMTTFLECTSESNGGGFYIICSLFVIQKTCFSRCFSRNGIAFYSSALSSLQMNESSFDSNSGDGSYLWYSYKGGVRVSLLNSTDNHCVLGSHGGTIECTSVTIWLMCNFMNSIMVTATCFERPISSGFSRINLINNTSSGGLFYLRSAHSYIFDNFVFVNNIGAAFRSTSAVGSTIVFKNSLSNHSITGASYSRTNTSFNVQISDFGIILVNNSCFRIFPTYQHRGFRATNFFLLFIFLIF